jgi:hypothetical protein
MKTNTSGIRIELMAGSSGRQEETTRILSDIFLYADDGTEAVA